MSGQRSFFAELKRRNVVRAAVLYAGGVWALSQGFAQLAPIVGAPDWAVRWFLIAAAIGFPFWIVFAWFYEWTPHGFQRDSEVAEDAASRHTAARKLDFAIIAVLVVAVALLASGYFIRSATPDDPAMLAVPAKSIAVLPFENLSTDKGNAYFADGMQDLILTKLADIGDLKVISRTSTMKYASHPDDVKTIGQQLGVATILEGSVQKAGNDVLINVQLIDAATDNHIWAHSYTRTLDNIFGVEGEVAQKVAAALKATLTEKEDAAVTRVPTSNKQAYQNYLKAIYFLDNSNRSGDQRDLERSVALARQAVAADPDFEEAWALLALGYQKLGNHYAEEEHASRRALELKPDDADAHDEYAFALMNQRKFDAAIAEAREAARLDPKGTHYGLGIVYVVAGHLDEAAAVFEEAVRAYPQISFGRKWVAKVAMRRHDYATARDQLKRVTASDPGDAVAAHLLALTQVLGWGDLDAARRALEATATPVASSGELSDAWFWQYMYQRDYPAALRTIAAAPSSWFGQQDTSLWLYEAQAYRASGDNQHAALAFARARDQFQAQITSGGDTADLHDSLALALAGLGDARAEVEMQRAIRNENVFAANAYQLDLAVVEAWTGRTDAALAQLDKLLAMPAGNVVSVASLKLDPTWDGLRKDPRFQALLKKYDKTRPGAASSGGAP